MHQMKLLIYPWTYVLIIYESMDEVILDIDLL